MARVRVVARVLVACAVVGACTDQIPGFEPDRPPSFSLNDGSSGGNPHFHFLQPIGLKNAGGNPGGWEPGTVHITTLSPVVEIVCLPPGCDPQSNVTFSGEDVQSFDTHYQADVSGNNVPLTLDGTYAITVSVATQAGTLVLGSATHVIADNAQRNLSVKFRVEDGALCYDGPVRLEACGTATLEPDDGGVVIIEIEEDVVASLFVAPEFRSTPTTFLFTRLTDLPCLDTDFAEFEGCFSLTLDPPLEPGERFAEGTVWIGYCLDPRVRPDYVEKYKTPDRDGANELSGGITALDYYDGDVPHIPHEANLDCSSFDPVAQTVVAAAVQRVKRALRGPLAFVFGGKLYADDLVRHTSIRDASRFGYARLLSVVSPSLVGLTNLPVDLSATARYLASENARSVGLGHHHNDYVSGLPVRFRILDGAELCTAETGAAAPTPLDPNLPATGTASCAHTFMTAGTYHVVPNVDGRDYPSFTVTVTQWQATFLTPLADSNPPALPVQLTTGSGSVRIACAGAGCTFSTRSVSYAAKDFKGGKYSVNWKIAGVQAGDVLTFQVLLGTTPLPYVSSLVVASDPKYNVNSTLPIAWRIERPE